MIEGRTADAVAHARDARRIGHDGGEAWADVVALVQRQQIALESNDLTVLAEHRLTAAAADARPPAWQAGLAHSELRMGREDTARAMLERFAGARFAILPRDELWLHTVHDFADLAAHLGAAEHAAQIYDLLLPHADWIVVVERALTVRGSAHRVLGLLSALLRRWDDAERHLVAALASNERLGAAYWAARTRHEHAVVLDARGRPEDAPRAAELHRAAADAAATMRVRFWELRLPSGS